MLPRRSLVHMSMTEAQFYAAIEALAARNGISVELAGGYMAYIGDTPELCEDGRIVVRDDNGVEIARVHMPD